MTIHDPEALSYLGEYDHLDEDEQFHDVQSVIPDVPDDVLERLVGYDVAYRKSFSGIPFCNFRRVSDRAEKLIERELGELGLSRGELGYPEQRS
jgi:hypothetical protein